MYRVEAFALEHNEVTSRLVAVVQVIQRCQTIETHVFELLKLSFSVIASASDEMLSTGKSLILP